MNIYTYMSNYKKYFLRQLGISESSIKPPGIDPSDVDPKELEMGTEDEMEHTNDPKLAQTVALHHLKHHGDFYSKIKQAGLGESPSHGMSPTARSSQVIAMAVRGSSTGGLPSGADRTMSPPQIDGVDVNRFTKGQLGGYEPIPTDKNNSELIDKTPANPQINSSSPKVDSPQTQMDPHPFQVQTSQGEKPQAVTGASTDGDDTLKLKMAVPDGVDVDVSEGEDEDNHSNNPEFQEKDKEQFRKDRSASPEGDAVRDELGIHEGWSTPTDEEDKDPKAKIYRRMQALKLMMKPFGPDDPRRAKIQAQLQALHQKLDAATYPTNECTDCGCDCDCDCDEKSSEDKVNETFARHKELLKKKLDEGKHKDGCQCGFCKNKGSFGKKKKTEEEEKPEVAPTNDKDGKKLIVDKDKDKNKKLNESYTAPFSRMLGLANLGQKRLLSNGLWSEPIVERSDLPAFKVTYEDGESYITSMAKGVTLDAAKKYFLGQYLTQPDEVTKKKVVNVEPA